MRQVPSYRLKRRFKDGTRSQALKASGSARAGVRSHSKRTVKGPSLVAATGGAGEGRGSGSRALPQASSLGHCECPGLKMPKPSVSMTNPDTVFSGDNETSWPHGFLSQPHIRGPWEGIKTIDAQASALDILDL